MAGRRGSRSKMVSELPGEHSGEGSRAHSPVDLAPVALDAMGGDRAPEATVAGAVEAAREYGIPVLLVGDQTQLAAELARHSPAPSSLQIVHAPSVIGMDESPGQALLKKRDASVVVAANLVREGKASALVSAGNSGAVTGAAVLRLGMLPGVDRPAIASVLPSQRGDVVVLDVGATMDPTPEQLAAFARVGERYARCMLSLERPRVGLLSIGEEASKGNALVKKTFPLLETSGINFVGNVEGGDVARGTVDVVVCDGFTGNVLLKVAEGYAEFAWQALRKALESGWRTRLGALLCRPALRRLARQLDYSAYGGALLLGVRGVVIIAHGRSSPAAVKNAIRVGQELAAQRVVEELAVSFAQDSAAPGGQGAAPPGTAPPAHRS